MTAGTLGYYILYFVLFWVCMHLSGLVSDAPTMLAAFALGRLLTAVAVTPGGLGLVEAGSVALLVALGADRGQAAGGVLLFTISTHLLEIPFVASAWLVWLGSGNTRHWSGVVSAPTVRQSPDSRRPATWRPPRNQQRGVDCRSPKKGDHGRGARTR